MGDTESLIPIKISEIKDLNTQISIWYLTIAKLSHTTDHLP